MTNYARHILAAGLVTMCAVAAPNAHTSDTVTAVPFAFEVGSASLPRDTYQVSTLPGQSGGFMIRSLRHGAIVLSQPDGPSDKDNSPRLVFHKYGDRHFLREVRLAGSAGFSVAKTPGEIDAAERMAAGSRPEVIVLRTGGDRALVVGSE